MIGVMIGFAKAEKGERMSDLIDGRSGNGNY